MQLTEEEEELIRKLRKKKKNQWKPRSLDSYTELEKAEAFDKFYELAYSEYKRINHEENYYEDNDVEHWCYEAVMKLLGDGFWDYAKSRT